MPLCLQIMGTAGRFRRPAGVSVGLVLYGRSRGGPEQVSHSCRGGETRRDSRRAGDSGGGVIQQGWGAECGGHMVAAAGYNRGCRRVFRRCGVVGLDRRSIAEGRQTAPPNPSQPLLFEAKNRCRSGRRVLRARSAEAGVRGPTRGAGAVGAWYRYWDRRRTSFASWINGGGDDGLVMRAGLVAVRALSRDTAGTCPLWIRLDGGEWMGGVGGGMGSRKGGDEGMTRGRGDEGEAVRSASRGALPTCGAVAGRGWRAKAGRRLPGWPAKRAGGWVGLSRARVGGVVRVLGGARAL